MCIFSQTPITDYTKQLRWFLPNQQVYRCELIFTVTLVTLRFNYRADSCFIKTTLVFEAEAHGQFRLVHFNVRLKSRTIEHWKQNAIHHLTVLHDITPPLITLQARHTTLCSSLSKLKNRIQFIYVVNINLIMQIISFSYNLIKWTQPGPR